MNRLNTAILLTILLFTVKSEYSLKAWELWVPFGIYVLSSLIYFIKDFRKAYILKKIKDRQAAVREKWRKEKIQKVKDRITKFKNRRK
ncbi:MAG: hypothetical protein QM489_01140 [Candidatus Izemoplasma sp.]